MNTTEKELIAFALQILDAAQDAHEPTSVFLEDTLRNAERRGLLRTNGATGEWMKTDEVIAVEWP